MTAATTPKVMQDTVSKKELSDALRLAAQLRRTQAWGTPEARSEEFNRLESVFDALTLQVHFFLNKDAKEAYLRTAAENAFQLACALPAPQGPLDKATWLVEHGCYAVLGEQSAEFKRRLTGEVMPKSLLAAEDWGVRARATSLAVWLHLLRRKGMADLNAAKLLVLDLLLTKEKSERDYLQQARKLQDPRPAASLVVHYNQCEAAAILSDFLINGAADPEFDIRKRLTAHFRQAAGAAQYVRLLEIFNTNALLAQSAQDIVTAAIAAKKQSRRTKKHISASTLESQAEKSLA